jgi:hypothetical protein
MEKHIRKGDIIDFQIVDFQIVDFLNMPSNFLPIFGDSIEYVDDNQFYFNIHGPGCIKIFENKKIQIKLYYYEYIRCYNKLDWQNQIKNL